MAHGRGEYIAYPTLRMGQSLDSFIGGVVLRFLVSSRIWWGLLGVTI